MKYSAPPPPTAAASTDTTYTCQRRSAAMRRHPTASVETVCSASVITAPPRAQQRHQRFALGKRPLELPWEGEPCYVARPMRRLTTLALALSLLNALSAAGAEAPKPETLLQQMKAWLEPPKSSTRKLLMTVRS